MIYFVDDEPERIGAWVRLFRATFRGTVDVVPTAAEALHRLIEGEIEGLRLVVWDLMMPISGGLDPDETEFGTRTGLALFRRFRQRHPDVPSIVLTNVREDRLLAELNAMPNVRAGRKCDLLPMDLVKVAQALGVQVEA